MLLSVAAAGAAPTAGAAPAAAPPNKAPAAAAPATAGFAAPKLKAIFPICDTQKYYILIFTASRVGAMLEVQVQIQIVAQIA